jgi:glutathione S-transferase
MRLYYAPGACSLAPHIVIREAGLDVALEKVNFADPERRTESGRKYYEVNPQGAVPALELGNGEVLTEAQVLLQYLAAQAPEARLAPSEGMARWRLLETLNFIATELHKGFGPFWKKGGEDAKEAARKHLLNRFGLLARKLGDKPYLMGDFSIADAYAFVMLTWARRHGVDLSGLPTLQAFYARMLARPAVQHALAEEGLPTS